MRTVEPSRNATSTPGASSGEAVVLTATVLRLASVAPDDTGRVRHAVEVDFRRIETVAQRTLHDPEPLPPEGVGELCRSDDLLPDSYEDWLTLEQERFRQLRLHALEARGAPVRELSPAARGGQPVSPATTMPC